MTLEGMELGVVEVSGGSGGCLESAVGMSWRCLGGVVEVCGRVWDTDIEAYRRGDIKTWIHRAVQALQLIRMPCNSNEI